MKPVIRFQSVSLKPLLVATTRQANMIGFRFLIFMSQSGFE